MGEIKQDHISREDYDHGCHVYDNLGGTSLGGYTKLYCFTDAALLANVLNHSENWPWILMDWILLTTCPLLKMRGAEVDLINDQDMYLFFEEGVGGGVRLFRKAIVRQIISIPAKVTILPKSRCTVSILTPTPYIWEPCKKSYLIRIWSGSTKLPCDVWKKLIPSLPLALWK